MYFLSTSHHANLTVERACVVRIQHDDWSIRLGENRPDRSSIPIKHLETLLCRKLFMRHIPKVVLFMISKGES